MRLAGLFASACLAPALLAVIAPEAVATETKTYTYDALGRLVSQVSTGTVNANQAHTYCYDAAGNRVQVVSSTAGATATCPSGTQQAQIAIGNQTVTEGGALVFTVTRSGSTSAAVSVSYASANGTAVAPGDYTSGSGTVSFAAGETSKTITITTIDDASAESTETMTVVLSNPSGAVITGSTGTGTINDNDTAPANLVINDPSVTEGGVLSFVVTRSGNTAPAVSASYATSNGTAVAPGDYTTATGTVSFAANETSKTISVTTIDDTAVESSEAMTMTLSNPSGATIVDGSGTGTIADNDTAPTPIQITGDNLAVLPAHTGTYSCSYYVDWTYGFWDLRCWLNSNNTLVYVYSNLNGPDQTDPGYSVQGTFRLYVQSNYYNTGVAP